jgi:hypothetical protein
MLNLREHCPSLYRQYVLFMILLMILLLFLVPDTSVLADSPVLQGTVSAGSLGDSLSPSYSATGSIGGTATFTMPFSASDLTGSGSGWNLTITSTPFATSGNTHTLPTTASTITGISAACTSVGTCSQATLTSDVTLPMVIPAGTTPPTATRFFGTATNTGMGAYTLTPTIAIAIPTGTLLGTYTTTFTVTISSGP